MRIGSICGMLSLRFTDREARGLKRWLAWMLLAVLLLGSLSAQGEEDPAKQVLDILWAGNPASIRALHARMDETAQAQITPEVLLLLKAQLTQAYGHLESVGATDASVSGEVTVYRLPVYLARQSLQMQLAVQGERIIGLAFVPLQAAVTPAPVEAASGLKEIEIIVGEGTAYPLPGILTLPETGEKVPLVVLVHGSGPNDRNETAGATRLFYDLAQTLAEQGIASIRYDKRTYAHGATFTQEQIANLTVREETIEDAIMAARLAATFEEIDAERIYLVGHSLGAMLAPRIAAEAENLFAGMILLAGSPRTLLEIMIDQNQAIVDNLSGDIKEKQQLLLDAYVADARRVLALEGEVVKKETIFGQPAYYFWEMNQYDTAQLLAKSKLPALIINGGRDFQIEDTNGYLAWQAVAAELEHVEIIYKPDLNHMLMVYTGDPALQGTSGEYQTPAQLDADTGAEIAQWILNH